MSSGGNPVTVDVELANVFRAGVNWKRLVVKYQIANATNASFSPKSITVGNTELIPVSGYHTTVPENGIIKVIYAPSAIAKDEQNVLTGVINLSFSVDVGGTEFPVDDEVEIIDTDPCAYGGE